MMSWMQREAMLTVWHERSEDLAHADFRPHTPLASDNQDPAEPIVAISQEMRHVLGLVDRVADTELSILLRGETGSGKELIARRLHDRSSRRQRVFMPINCGALPKDLVDGELFGAEQGAYTGADRRRPGRFEMADRGTVFLDEVGELELSVQAKLLRVLQEGEIHRLGASGTTHVDARVIAATNRDLQAMVREGSFREDLYFRLNGFTLELPPLRGRSADIRELINRTVQRARRRSTLPIEDFSETDLRRLEQCAWKGNVRELLNVVNRSVALMENGRPTLELWEPESPDAMTTQPEHGRLDDVIRSHLAQTLERCAWVIEGDMGAAARLGVAPSTLRSQIKRFGVPDPRRQSH
jgi:formate hydrogenlyase transcriptional activator